MSELATPKPEDAEKKGGASGSGNKLLLIIALGNFLGVFALGGYLAYDKLIASPAAAQAAKGDKKAGAGAPGAEHGAEKAEGHGDAGEGHGEKGGDHGDKKAAGHGAGPDVDESLNPPDGPGPIMALEPIVTNLAEPDGDRYLKVTVQLRVTSEAAKSEVEASIVPIRSQILMYFSSLNMSDISGAEKRRLVQSQVRRIANEAMPSSRIRFVYFTEFVVQ